MAAPPDGIGSKPTNSPQNSRLNRPSIDVAARIPLPPSSPGLSSPRDAKKQVLSPLLRRSSPNLLRRTSSSASLDRQPPSPSLLHRASSSSLRNDDGARSPRLPSRQPSASEVIPETTFEAQEAVLLTANSIAAEHFAQEMAQHAEGSSHANTVVILHDACYGHRFARPSSRRVAEQNLEYTFERPERIEATALGIAAAYVLLGDRHAEGRHAPQPEGLPPKSVPFHVKKTTRNISLQSPFVIAVHGLEWMSELVKMCESAGERLPLAKELERIKSSITGDQDKEALHSGDLYLCPESIHALEGALGGVCDGVDAVFHGVETGTGPRQAYVSVRPPGHHCAAHMPSGFCWLNNVHVGIEYAAKTYNLTHAAIFDFDLHHGDGSQAIAWQRNAKAVEAMQPAAAARDQTLKPRNYNDHVAIGYYSIHDIESYPCESGDLDTIRNASVCIDNCHGQSIWNVHLESWQTPEDFWRLYESRYLILVDKMRSFLRLHTHEIRKQEQALQNAIPKRGEKSKAKGVPRPKAAIFISAGFDASEHENPFMQRHGKKVMTEFYARITQDIARLAQEVETGVEGRIISVLEGGYSNRALFSGVLSHLCGLCQTPSYRPDAGKIPGADDFSGDILVNELNKLQLQEALGQDRYDVQWWEQSRLLALERLLDPEEVIEVVPVPEPRKAPKLGGFSDPTQSSTARAVDTSKIHKHTSWSASRGPVGHSSSRSTGRSPPLPEVNWLVACQELCRLLVPSHRQTKSHTVEELTLITATKKPRHTTIGLPPMPANGERQLRDRSRAKQNAALIASSDNLGTTRAERTVSRSDRRKTIADLPLSSDNVDGEGNKRGNRRSSVASTISSNGAMAPVRSVQQPLSKPPDMNVDFVQIRKARVVSPSLPPIGAAPPHIPSTAGVPSRAGPLGTDRVKRAESGVDALTSGLRRIKINVPTNEEYAARQAKKASEREKPLIAIRTTSAKTALKKQLPESRPTAARKAMVRGHTASKTKTVSSSPGNVASASPTSPSDHPVTPNVFGPQGSSAMTTQPAAALSGSVPLAVTTMHPSVPALQFQHEYPVDAPALPFHVNQSLQWQPMNADVPQVRDKAAASNRPHSSSQAPSIQQEVASLPPSVPKFSATGHIPFAPTHTSVAAVVLPSNTVLSQEVDTKKADLWAVPETPQR